ncbi:MAG: threonine/serine exporter family protein [Clostridia bacterium]|nr:threonine/serine exporter family protein [Clostridia bacterium]
MIRSLLIGCIGAFGGTVGFGFMLNAPRRVVLPSSLTAVLGYLLYDLLFRFAGQSLIFSYFFATVVISVICEIAARVMRMPSTIFLLSALVPLVPGYSFYCAMLALVENDGAAAASHGLMAVQIVAAIAVGAAVTSVAFRSVSGYLRRARG